MRNDPEKPYFLFNATLRIHGDGLDLDGITRAIGLQPTHVHRKGDRRGARGSFPDDAWHYSSSMPREATLDAHIQALWMDVAPAAEFLRALKAQHRVDVFCSYRSDSDTAGFEISPRSLAIFQALDVPLGVSVIVATDVDD